MNGVTQDYMSLYRDVHRRRSRAGAERAVPRRWASIPIGGTIGSVGKNTSFSLDEHYSTFIDDEVASGRYRSASDVVRSALRLLEDRETQLRGLRQALIEGERSGES